MDEAIRAAMRTVGSSGVSRRQVVRALAALGMTSPMISALLDWASAAHAGPSGVEPKAGPRGGGGPLRMLFWQAPMILNGHVALGDKDSNAASIFYEPLATYDAEARLVPVLATSVPGRENGQVTPDGLSVVWNLKRGVHWHDGRPFTADDVVFTWEYAIEGGVGGRYRDLERVERLNDHAVRVVFREPTAFWAEAFCGIDTGQILPRHVFGPFRGRAREAPANYQPVGTGPYRCVEFRPGDVIRAELNPYYHVAGRPFFDTLELKGGGDAPSAARAVLQTGDYDYAWNLQVEDEWLTRLERGDGRGRLLVTPTAQVEHILLNLADPWREVDGERSSARTPHPILADPLVRRALGLLIDRAAIASELYGRFGSATGSILNWPAPFVSPNVGWAFDPAGAESALEAAGWRRGPDGVRAKEGRRLRLLFQTSTNRVRQNTQAVVKQACARAGIEIEVKAVLPSVFFDNGSADGYARFHADLQMFYAVPGPDPLRFMERFTSWRIPSKATGWSGTNVARWRNDGYDALWRAARSELDAARRAALFIRMNDLVVASGVVIPVVQRARVEAVSRGLQVETSPWNASLWSLATWHRRAQA
jgi:peptide/nickel transport system substrate-binding protein